MNITPEQLQHHKNSLALIEAEIDLNQKEMDTWAKRGEAERNLYAWIADISADPSVKRTPLRAYFEAHKAHYAALGELKQLAIIMLRSKLEITKAMVEEAEKMIATPGKGLITTN